ncbi:DUF3192 domain-containing protein [Aliikangiella maris]|uniref:DUF3192 domain-containing protein n=2 Tax=Aliikangiella maris TaxID=3162458 RepID=A0ABV2BTD0_9GAMM
MKYFAHLLASLFLISSLSGCIIVGERYDDDGHHSSWEERQRENRQIISQLPMQSSRKSVLDQLGAPEFSEAYTKGNDEYRILYYRTQRKHDDGDTTIDETTPLVFKNDQLLGWGEQILKSVSNL